jgi:hypothetical protein
MSNPRNAPLLMANYDDVVVLAYVTSPNTNIAPFGNDAFHYAVHDAHAEFITIADETRPDRAGVTDWRLVCYRELFRQVGHGISPYDGVCSHVIDEVGSDAFAAALAVAGPRLHDLGSKVEMDFSGLNVFHEIECDWTASIEVYTEASAEDGEAAGVVFLPENVALWQFVADAHEWAEEATLDAECDPLSTTVAEFVEQLDMALDSLSRDEGGTVWTRLIEEQELLLLTGGRKLPLLRGEVDREVDEGETRRDYRRRTEIISIRVTVAIVSHSLRLLDKTNGPEGSFNWYMEHHDDLVRDAERSTDHYYKNHRDNSAEDDDGASDTSDTKE